MKKYILSLLVAVGLIGSASAQSIITITDLSNGKSTNYSSQTFNGFNAVQIDSCYVSIGDALSINWGYSIPTPPSYASSVSQSSNGLGYIGIPWGIPYAQQSWSYSNSITINGASSILDSGEGKVGGPNASSYYSSLTFSNFPTNFSTNFTVSNTNLINWSTSFTTIASSQSASYDRVLINAQYGVYDYVRSWSTNSTTQTWTDSVTIKVVPEPSTYALFGLGAIGMLMVMRRKKTA